MAEAPASIVARPASKGPKLISQACELAGLSQRVLIAPCELEHIGKQRHSIESRWVLVTQDGFALLQQAAGLVHARQGVGDGRNGLKLEHLMGGGRSQRPADPPTRRPRDERAGAQHE
jgi:hypothetical protein